MPHVEMIAHEPCRLCGYRLPTMWFASVRVNKRSLRTLGGLIATPFHHCPECSTPRAADTHPLTWRLTPESQAVIAEHRESKGWPA